MRKFKRRYSAVLLHFCQAHKQQMTLANEYSAFSVQFHVDGANIILHISNLSNNNEMYAKAADGDTVVITENDERQAHQS